MGTDIHGRCIRQFGDLVGSTEPLESPAARFRILKVVHRLRVPCFLYSVQARRRPDCFPCPIAFHYSVGWCCLAKYLIDVVILSGILRKWQSERRPSSFQYPTTDFQGVPQPHPAFGAVCERIVVFNKRDLVAEWGIEVG